MRHLLVIGCLVLAYMSWVENAVADVEAIKSRLAYAKANNEAPEDTLLGIFNRAKISNEKPEDTLKDIISTEPTLAYPAFTTAISTYPNLKTLLVQTAIDSGLNSQLVNAIANAAATQNNQVSHRNIARDASNRAEVNLNKSGQTVNQSISLPVSSPISLSISSPISLLISSPTSSGSTGAGGLLQQTNFIPVNNIIIPIFNGTNNSVGGGGCGSGMVLTKNATTGVSRCASKS
jgi:hypothetical protein